MDSDTGNPMPFYNQRRSRLLLSDYCYHDYYSRRHDHRSAALLRVRKKLIIIE